MAAEEAAHAQVKPRTPFFVLIGLACVLAFAGLLTFAWRKMATQTQNIGANQPLQAASLSPAVTVTPISATPTPKPDAGIPQTQSLSPTQVADTRSGKAPLTRAAARDVVHRGTDIAGDTTSDVTRPIRVVDSGEKSRGDSDTPPSLDTANQGSQMLASVLNVPTSLPRRVAPISQGIQGGELQRRVDPIYPAQAKTLRQQGTVVLQAFITETGLVREVKVVSGPPILGEAAAVAVRQWKYNPFQLNGKPVTMETQVKVTFKLP
jgi:TonB family protein